MVTTRNLVEAVEDFESQTTVERNFFLLLDSSSGECEDPVALRMAGTRITEAALRLLEALDHVRDTGTGSRAAGGTVLRLERPTSL